MSFGLGRGDFGLSSSGGGATSRPRGSGRRTLTEEQRAEVSLKRAIILPQTLMSCESVQHFVVFFLHHIQFGWIYVCVIFSDALRACTLVQAWLAGRASEEALHYTAHVFLPRTGMKGMLVGFM